ncbi:MAG: fibronectin type III domain-containing protein [Coriobacteriia bacterium]|nr:fibronectin type III domain-containing protein [Coriobacteriia bacterium]
MKRSKIVVSLLGVALAAGMAPAVAMAATPPTINQGAINLTQPVSGSSIKIGWEKDPAATKYAVRYSRSSSMKNAKVKYFSKGTTSTTITNLKAGYNYWFQVRAYGKTTSKTPKYKWSKARHCPTAYKGKANSYSWAKLKSISKKISACKSKSAALSVARSYGLIGASKRLSGYEYKTLKINGKTFRAQIVDFWKDKRKDGTRAGITFMLKECTGYMPFDVDGGIDWVKSDTRTQMNNSYKDFYPTDLGKYICAVKRINWNGDFNTSTCYDYVSIPSVVELWGPDTAAQISTGWKDRDLKGECQYKYFADCNVGTFTKWTIWDCDELGDGPEKSDWYRNSSSVQMGIRLAKSTFNGAATGFWTRDASDFDDDQVFHSSRSGELLHFSSSNVQTASFGIRPVFCI